MQSNGYSLFFLPTILIRVLNTCIVGTPAFSPALSIRDEGEVTAPQQPLRAEVLDQRSESRLKTLVRVRVLRRKNNGTSELTKGDEMIEVNFSTP